MSESEGEKKEKDQATFHQALFQTAMKVTKHSNELPSSNLDWDYYQSFPPFASAMKSFGDRIATVMTKIYSHYGLSGRVAKLDFEEQLEYVSDSNDVLMERINNSLDEAAGIKKQAETVVVEMMAKTSNLNGSWNRHATSSPAATPYRLLTAKNILRPQLKFKEKITNKAGPFVPKIKEKPHSLKPLAILMEINDFGEEEFSHPYEFELERFSPDPKFFSVANEAPAYKKIEETPLVMVENEASLVKMVADLSSQSVIAVDLEAHSYRSFQGITCLMQISTIETDYIVDTLELWDQLQPLNEVFCNPKIVKVFHGADSDVEWLQRDLGLYVVNMFDTYHAAKLLNFAQLSLAFLLRHYCQVMVDKQFQLADWRIRPIPQEMIKYAREDTHYLIHVYERLKQDLKTKGNGDNLLKAVWQNSRLICLKRYRIPRITPESHLELYRLSKKVFNERQLYALKELFAWRDRVAREEDESVGFVLPKHMMLQIADILPKEMQGILACCSPIPPLVRQHLLHLHEIIRKAREMPLSSLQNHGQPLAIPKHVVTSLDRDMEDPLHCVHDLTHSQDVRDDLPTLISSQNTQSSYAVEPMDESDGISVVTKPSPRATIFASSCKTIAPTTTVSFVSPFTRYTRAKATESAKERPDEERIESLRKHFIDAIQSTSAGTQESPGDSAEVEAKAESPVQNAADAEKKIKKKLPLSVQIGKKRKRGAGKKSAGIRPRETTQLTPSSSTGVAPSEKFIAVGTTHPTKKLKLKKKGSVQQDGAQEATASSASGFAPFDYSQVNYEAFQKRSGRSGDSGRGRGRGRGSGRGGGGGRGPNNARIHRKSGQKSMTYSAK